MTMTTEREEHLARHPSRTGSPEESLRRLHERREHLRAVPEREERPPDRPLPAIVITRDRVRYARRCVAALRTAGLEVHVADRGSTYPEMTAQLLLWQSVGVIRVHRLGDGHPRGLWEWDGLPGIVGDRRYVVTDCDVVPDASCPVDWVGWLDTLLDLHPDRVKVGLGLKLTDVPDGYEHAEAVRAWESQWWERRLSYEGIEGSDDEATAVYDADVDTTLALYRALGDDNAIGGRLTLETEFSVSRWSSPEGFTTGRSLRTGSPYLARHLPWYEVGPHVADDEVWYRRHLPPLVSHWSDPGAYLAASDEERNGGKREVDGDL